MTFKVYQFEQPTSNTLGRLVVVSVTNLVLCFTGLVGKNGTSWPLGNKG